MGTATGLRISAVDGTAFLDNCPADILAAVGKQVKIYDASNRFLLGVIGAVGSSEGLGSEKITGWTNSTFWPMETLTTSGSDIIQAINDSTETPPYGRVGSCYGYTSAISKALYKFSTDITINSGSNLRIATGAYGWFPYSYISAIVNGLNTKYFTIAHPTFDNCVGFFNPNGSVINFAASSNTLKQVTAPSSSGVTILNAIGGAQNFVSKDASFTYNAASYSYEIISGHPTIKRFGAVPYCTNRLGVF